MDVNIFSYEVSIDREKQKKTWLISLSVACHHCSSDQQLLSYNICVLANFVPKVLTEKSYK